MLTIRITKGKCITYLICYIQILSIPFIFMPETVSLLAQQQDAEILLQQGKQDYMMGRFDEAIDKLSQAIELLTEEEKLIDAYLYLAISNFALDQIEETKEALNKLVSLQPQYKIDPLFYPPDFIKLHEQVIKKNLAHINLHTEPEDAEVYLDGELVGRSPLKIANISPGEHRLKLVKEGYKAKEQSLVVKEGEEKTVSFELEKEEEEKKPVVAVTPPEKKPEVKKGKVWLWILIGGAAAAAVAIFATRGGKETATGGTAPTPTFGSIQVKSYPNGAAIFLDGQNTDFRTNHTLTNVSTGSHTILLRLAGWKDWQDEVTVYGNQTAVVKPCLLPPNGCFRDNFQDGDANGWDLDPGWQVRSQGGNYFFEGITQYPGSGDATPHIDERRNFSLRFRLRVVSFYGGSGHFSIQFRDGSQGHNVICFNIGHTYCNKEFYLTGESIHLAEGRTVSRGEWHNIEIAVRGDKIQLFINNRLTIDINDRGESLGKGVIKFHIADGGHAQIDDIVITSDECP